MAWTTPITHATGDVVPASDWNTYIRDNTNFLYGDTAWTVPTYTNSWVDFGGGLMTVAFRRIGTRVVLRGTMKSGTINTAAFTLPVGYRPPGQAGFITDSSGAAGFAAITSAGVVTPVTGSTLGFGFDGVEFDTI